MIHHGDAQQPIVLRAARRQQVTLHSSTMCWVFLLKPSTKPLPWPVTRTATSPDNRWKANTRLGRVFVSANTNGASRKRGTRRVFLPIRCFRRWTCGWWPPDSWCSPRSCQRNRKKSSTGFRMLPWKKASFSLLLQLIIPHSAERILHLLCSKC